MYAHYNSVVVSYRKPNAFYGVSSFDYLKNDDNNNKYHCDRDAKILRNDGGWTAVARVYGTTINV